MNNFEVTAYAAIFIIRYVHSNRPKLAFINLHTYVNADISSSAMFCTFWVKDNAKSKNTFFCERTSESMHESR
jgi:hypothetical protein